MPPISLLRFLSARSALLFPACGLIFLAYGLTSQLSLVPPEQKSEAAPPLSSVQRDPRRVNPVRLTILRRQYQFYLLCQADLRQARTPQQRADGRSLVSQAAALYNQAAGDTDPSAFAGTTLPHHL